MSALETPPARYADRLLGASLVRAGRLKPEDAERILRLQREQGLRFGEAAIKLQLLSAADLELALALQFGHRCLVRGESKVSEALVVAYAASGAQVETLRALRTQLVQRWFDGSAARKALAVVSPARNEGRSFIAASLAVMFSQLGHRTLLIDADMRHPSQHGLFGLDERVGLSAVLSGRAGPEAIQPVASLPDLSVLAAGALPPNPLELLARPLFPKLLNDMAQTFDVILLDTPAAAECGDAHTAALHAGAALLVTRKNVTRLRHARAIADALAQASATVVGTVLNDF
jgi:receptor protein-tyrosine kinase